MALSFRLPSLGRLNGDSRPSSHRPVTCALFLSLALIFCLSTLAHPAQVTVQWDPSVDPEVVGYKVYYGTSSRQYQYAVDVGGTTTCTLSSLQEGVPYYIAATAYDAARAESDFSAEIFYTAGGCVYSLSSVSQSFPSAGGAGSVSLSTGAGCAWTAVSNAAWIILTSNSSGSGNGSVAFTVASNPTSNSRTGTLTIAGTSLTINQQGATQYILSLNRTGSGFGTVTAVPAAAVYSPGTAVTLTASPDASSTFAGWSGACSGTSPTCSLTMDANKTVTAAFNPKAFSIVASAGPNGAITPQGTVWVNYGASQSFTITPAAGYGISDVRVDGISIGAVTSYLFGNVMAGHTLTASFAALPSPAPADLTLAVNAGGDEYTDRAGVRYLADRYFTGGSADLSSAPVLGTGDPGLYQSERYGRFSYALPVPNGSYDVTLRFVESAFGARNQRVFDVQAEGRVVLNALDLYAVSGSNTAVDFTFTVSVGDGVLNLDFLPRKGDAQVSAILVKTATGPSKNPPGRAKRFYTTQARTD